jgi:hypothetical protein
MGTGANISLSRLVNDTDGRRESGSTSCSVITLLDTDGTRWVSGGFYQAAVELKYSLVVECAGLASVK